MAENYLITGYWGEPHVTAENDRGINAATFGIGRFVLPVGERFRAEYIGNNIIRMYDGKLLDNGAAAGIPAGEYVDLKIANAGQGMKRNDLVVFQYSQDASTMIESGSFVVVKGSETSGAASDPALTQADLLSGTATFDQMPLLRVSVSGTAISAPVPVFSVANSLADSISTYTHNYSGGVHNFVGTGSNGKVLIKTAFSAGNTFAVNGVSVPAYMGSDAVSELPVGRWATFTFDGEQLNFKGGGGKVTAEGLTAENIVSGQTVTIKQGSKAVISVVGTAPVSNIAAIGGYSDSDYAVQSGTAETPTFNISVAGTYQIITSAGGYDGGSATITASKNGTSLGSKTQGNGYGRHVWSVSCAAGDVLAISYTRTSIYVGIEPILTVLLKTD